MKNLIKLDRKSNVTGDSGAVLCKLMARPIIERLVIGNICSYFKGSPIAVIKSSEYEDKIYVKVASIPWFLREIGAELCFDVVRVLETLQQGDMIEIEDDGDLPDWL